eukprot:gene15641-17220_t
MINLMIVVVALEVNGILLQFIRVLAGCEKPGRFPHGKKKIRGTKIGSLYAVKSSVRYRCNRGYHLVGSERGYCQADGTWNGFKAKCVSVKSKRRFCKVPSAPVNGTVKGEKLTANSWIRYSCDANFKLVGPSKRVCRRNGKWSRYQPYCEPTFCTDPGHIANGVRHGSVFKKQSSVLYTCNSGFEMVGENIITCFRDASWSASPPQCLTEREALAHKAKKLSENFVDKLKVLTVDGKGRSGLSRSAQGLDLVFALDYSQSVGKVNFKKAVDFTRSMIEQFGLSSSDEGTHVAIVVFSDTPKLIFNLKSQKVFEKEVALRELENLKFSGGGTGPRLALNMVIKKVGNETRPNAKKVLFLITDGNYNVGGSPVEASKYLREKMGFSIYTIGISEVDRSSLEQIASLPFSKYIYLLKDYTMLDKLNELINKSSLDYRSCGMAGNTQSREPSPDAIVSKLGSWPWTVLVLIDGRMKCAGALLGDKWLITAAKCFEKGLDLSSIRVVAGMHHRSILNATQQKRRVKQVYWCPDKVKGKPVNLALVKIKGKFQLNSYTRTVCLADDYDYGFYVRPGKGAFVSGWGTVFPELHQGHVKFVTNERCRRQFGKSFNVTKSHLCVANSRDANAVCAGSIGSPLMVQRTRLVAGDRRIYSWALTGVLYRNDACDSEKEFSVFTDVQKSKEWIQKTMKIKINT